LKRPALPENRLRRGAYRIAVSDHLDKGVLGVIVVQALLICAQHEGQPAAMTDVLDLAGVGFASFFVIESAVKIFGFGVYGYFSSASNVFDFVVAAGSAVDRIMFMCEACADVESTALRLVKSLRVLRLMRLAVLIPGTRPFIAAIAQRAHAIGSVCLLLGMGIFVAANFGVALFEGTFTDMGRCVWLVAVRLATSFCPAHPAPQNHNHNHNHDRYQNWDNTFAAMQLMFIITTGDGWTDTMQGMISEAPEWKWVLILYFTTFTIIMAFMLIELFVMVVCEAFEVLRHVLSTTTLLHCFYYPLA